MRAGELEESLRGPVAEIFGAAHTTVMRFSTRIYQEQKRMNYVTPTNYLELVQGYMKMLKDKQKELGAAADKLRNGLSKLDDARVQVAEMSVDLEEKQKICDVKAKECEELLKVITAERSKADAQQAQVESDSIRIEKEAKERTSICTYSYRTTFMRLTHTYCCRMMYFDVIHTDPCISSYLLTERSLASTGDQDPGG